MVVFRALLFVALVAVGVFAALYLFTGNRSYLRWSGRLLKLAITAGLLFFAVLILERVA